jgi:Asp-tRNA(Asn)/Glu-tRNA(Gln) amidotransferase A subunit family amidase
VSEFPALSRRRVLAALGGMGIGSAAFAEHLAAQVAASGSITPDMVQHAEWLAGIEIEPDQRARLAEGLAAQLAGAARIRAVPLDADVPPALVFRPDFFAEPDPALRAGTAAPQSQPATLESSQSGTAPRTPVPSVDEVPWSSLRELANWLEAREISSVELTRLYLERLQRFDEQLKCVVTLLEESALEQAAESDRRRAAQQSLGLLDGIPWVAKDLIAVPPHKTTWGAEPYKEQVRPVEATVSRRLREAGGVLVAKVTLGALAMGDRWFGGMTRNPWNPAEGSSGSSAGTASAVAAGLAPYGIGSETLGSIVSPCRRCRVSGLRPTFGRISRAGCMALSWSMDKLGPIARHVADLGLIFEHLIGPDGLDPSVVARPFTQLGSDSFRQLTVGVDEAQLEPAEREALEWLRAEGVAVRPVKLPQRFPLREMVVILDAEATTMFDDLLRDQPDAEIGAWPSTFRRGQFISAVHYLRANRVRSMLIAETEAALREVDVVLGGDDLALTNLTGHPSLVVALGSERGQSQTPRPATVKLTAAMFRESPLLAVGAALQAGLPPVPARPDL